MATNLPSLRTPSDIREIIREDPLGEFFVWWMEPPLNYRSDFEQCLASARNENDLQKDLSSNPYVLATQLGGGQGRWAIPKKRLGAEYVPDFLIAERSSMGFEWYAVELESPKVKMFTKSGDPTHQLTHAMRQIDDWRAWLQTNQNYAARPQSEGGLGLTDISANLDGLILIGRASFTDESTNSRRREMARRSRVRIHSYDWLLGSGQLTNLPVRRITD
jgi:hypothetical protein